jgi:hypothetical protein
MYNVGGRINKFRVQTSVATKLPIYTGKSMIQAK